MADNAQGRQLTHNIMLLISIIICSTLYHLGQYDIISIAMKRRLKQWRSTNSPISTKRPIVSHLHSLSTHTKQQTNKLQRKTQNTTYVILKIQILVWEMHNNVALLNRKIIDLKIDRKGLCGRECVIIGFEMKSMEIATQF